MAPFHSQLRILFIAHFKMMLLFTNEVAIVTGASSGIGAEVASKLAELGIGKLCLTGRQLDSLNQTKQSCISKSNGKLTEDDITNVIGDLSDEATCKKIVDKTIESFGQVDILINNAGMIKLGPLESCPIEDFDQLMNVNVRSMLVLSKLCIPHLRKTKGSIVNMGSVYGMQPFVDAGYHCMSKAAVHMFTQCLALELAVDGIRVNCVNPGLIRTNILTRELMTDQEFDKLLEDGKRQHPLGRSGEPEDVAKAVAFLASKKASFITGNITPVDGGRNLMCPR